MDFLAEAHRARAAGNVGTAYQMLVSGVRAVPTPQMWKTLGQSLHEHQRSMAACAAFKRGDLDGYETLVNLGWCLHQQGRSEEAAGYLRRAGELAPQEGLVWTDLSQVLLRTGEVEEALEASAKSVGLSADPSFTIAHAMALFANGRWAEGLRVYEGRIEFKLRDFLNYPFPRWDGGEVGRLLIQAEMGIGDGIWALRWVEEAASRVGRVLLYVHAELLSLVQRWAVRLGNVDVYAMPRELPDVDVYVPMLSLPNAMGLTVDGAPYISAYGRTGGEIRKVGIVWASSPTSEEARWRDIPIEEFMPLLEMPEIEVHSLQMGDAKGAIDQHGLHAVLRDRSPEISNFADTQGIIGGLDLVVGCDTAVMHLAGAMGKRAWVLRNQYAAPWIWPWGGGRCVWYDSADVMCRTRDELSWKPLLRRVVERIRHGG